MPDLPGAGAAFPLFGVGLPLAFMAGGFLFILYKRMQPDVRLKPGKNIPSFTEKYVYYFNKDRLPGKLNYLLLHTKSDKGLNNR